MWSGEGDHTPASWCKIACDQPHTDRRCFCHLCLRRALYVALYGFSSCHRLQPRSSPLGSKKATWPVILWRKRKPAQGSFVGFLPLTCTRHLCGLLPHPLRTCSRTCTPSEEDGPLSQHPRPAGPHVLQFWPLPMTLTLAPDKIPSPTCILRQRRPPYFHSCPQQRSGRIGLPLSAVSTSTGFSAGGSHRHGHWEVSRPPDSMGAPLPESMTSSSV